MRRKIPSLIKTKRFSIIGFSIVLVCVALIWVCQLNTVVTEAQTQTLLLKLEVSTPENSYLQLEPIQLNLKLSNQTNAPVAWRGYFKIGQDMDITARF